MSTEAGMNENSIISGMAAEQIPEQHAPIEPLQIELLHAVATGKLATISELEIAYQMLPRQMTHAEVEALGVGVYNLQERLHPSWNHRKDGRKLEFRALTWLGKEALKHDEPETADSVIAQLKQFDWIRPRIALQALRLQKLWHGIK